MRQKEGPVKRVRNSNCLVILGLEKQLLFYIFWLSKMIWFNDSRQTSLGLFSCLLYWLIYLTWWMKVCVCVCVCVSLDKFNIIFWYCPFIYYIKIKSNVNGNLVEFSSALLSWNQILKVQCSLEQNKLEIYKFNHL